MPEQERDAELERLLECYGAWWSQPYGNPILHETLNAIHARVAELVAKAREEGRQEGAKGYSAHPMVYDPVYINGEFEGRYGPITAIGKPDAFDGDPPPIFTPTETGAKL